MVKTPTATSVRTPVPPPSAFASPTTTKQEEYGPPPSVPPSLSLDKQQDDVGVFRPTTSHDPPSNVEDGDEALLVSRSHTPSVSPPPLLTSHTTTSMETEIDYEMGTNRLMGDDNEINNRDWTAGTTSHHHLLLLPPRRRSMWCNVCSRWSQLYHRSLAASSTTPLYATIGIPLAILATHGLFYHGQTANMWQLTSTSNVDCWYNATSFEAKSVYRLIGLGDPYNLQVSHHDASVIQTFTYYTAIQELWDAAGMNVNVFLPRLASVLLILFSGVWPHLKLFLLQVGWLCKSNSPRYFWWLATLGKWSLSDVLVVCVMLGVLHIDWNIDPNALLQGIIHQAPTIMKLIPDLYTNSQICTQLLERPCDERSSMSLWNTEDTTTMMSSNWTDTTPSNLLRTIPFLDWDLKCSACLHFVESSLAHPATFQSTVQGVADGISTSGGGLLTLRVQGLPGIYSFCAAVVLSIALSCWVDIYSIRASSMPQASPSASAAVTPPTCDPEISIQPPGGPDELENGLDHPLLLQEEQQQQEEIEGSADTSVTPQPVEETLHQRALEQRHMQRAASYASLSSSSSSSASSSPSSTARYHSLSRSSSSPESLGSSSCQSFWQSCAMILAIVTCAIVWKNIPAPSLTREVTGVGPHWLQQVTGVDWDMTFSLQTLAQAVGEAGGWDTLLQATFAWFCLIGPALRAALCVVALCCPLSACGCGTTSPLYSFLLTLIEFVGAFCAVEVLAIATYLVHLLIPSTTATIVNIPQCAQIAPPNSTATCFQVFLEPQDSFQWLVIGTILLLLLSQIPQWLLVRSQKQQHRRRHRHHPHRDH